MGLVAGEGVGKEVGTGSAAEQGVNVLGVGTGEVEALVGTKEERLEAAETLVLCRSNA